MLTAMLLEAVAIDDRGYSFGESTKIIFIYNKSRSSPGTPKDNRAADIDGHCFEQHAVSIPRRSPGS